MTRIRASVSAFAPIRRTLVTAALAALVLTGCGGGEPSGSRAARDDADSNVSAAPSTPEQVAFAAMLDKLAQPCSPTGAAASGPTDQKPTGAEGEQQTLAPGESPPTGPIEPGAPTEPAAQLNDRDLCASVQHEQRLIEALQTVPEPTPAEVRRILNGLGYIDERIHGLERDGKATRFYLDLREKGGRLCEAGLAAGEKTDVTVCTVPADGPFAAEEVRR
ncbi:hypothetical protein OKJ48_11495 [Streptomyces kunmingensis]|uniref:Lipoprotein n=1 Tax=Streptomyces kunmingensis TaxID=68225 RepID=A0ABU6C813_9ACTN|nr:hypothetical protein [Streptomyces kunmingensis]MEB3960863.1 hypothetical protein [Streptomyces kunmingensis]